ncbi:MAG: hypothetical protein WC565_03585 [Parcubacteria group bacterium]
MAYIINAVSVSSASSLTLTAPDWYVVGQPGDVTSEELHISNKGSISTYAANRLMRNDRIDIDTTAIAGGIVSDLTANLICVLE